jgi:hypothetical protein
VGEVTTIESYVAAVRDALGSLPAADRDEAVAELESLLIADAGQRGEAAALAALGTPGEYADSIRAALAGDAEGPQPQGRVLGMPYDFRGANTTRIAERIWNPSDPRVFMPRLFGVGWTFNFGAIAVKAGLIRPDDAGDEAYERVPDGAVRAALAVPALFALAAVAIVAGMWTSLPAEVPVHWSISGAPDDWAPKALALGGLLALTVLPVAVTYARVLRAGTPGRTRVLAASALALLTSICLGLVAMTVADADGGNSGPWALAVIGGGLAVSFLVLYVPLRFGMRAEWREDLGPEKGDV